MRSRLVMSLVSLALTACSTTGAKTLVLSPSAINASLLQYDGRTIVLRGYLKVGAEMRVIYESKTLSDAYARQFGTKDFKPAAWRNYCVTIANSFDAHLDLEKLNRKTVDVLAKVDAKYGTNAIDLGGCAIETGVEIVKIVKVHQ